MLREHRADLVDECLGSEAGGLGGAFVLVAMFVGTGDERDVLSSELAALKTRERVGREHFVRMADMRGAVAVGDRAGDVDAWGHSLDCSETHGGFHVFHVPWAGVTLHPVLIAKWRGRHFALTPI